MAPDSGSVVFGTASQDADDGGVRETGLYPGLLQGPLTRERACPDTCVSSATKGCCRKACNFGKFIRGKVHNMQEKLVQRGSKGFFAITVKVLSGWLLYDLRKDTYGKDWANMLSRC